MCPRVSFVACGLAKEMIELLSRVRFNRFVPPPEDSRAGGPLEYGAAVFNTHHRSFAEARYRRVVLLEELQYPFFLRFSHVRRVRIGIEKVRTDLKGNEPESIEGRRLNDRHVLCGLDSWTCDIRACARPNVRHPLHYPATDRSE